MNGKDFDKTLFTVSGTVPEIITTLSSDISKAGDYEITVASSYGYTSGEFSFDVKVFCTVFALVPKKITD